MKKAIYYVILVIIVTVIAIALNGIMLYIGFEGGWISAFAAGFCLSAIYKRKKIFELLDKLFKVKL